MYDARDLANLMLDLADERSFSLGNLDLNRLLFFLNGNYLSEFGCDLVDDDFVACADGPKIRNVFNAFSSSGARIVGCRAMRFDPFKEEYFYVQYSFPVAIVDYCAFILIAFCLGGYQSSYTNHERTQTFCQRILEKDNEGVFPQSVIPSAMIASYFNKLKLGVSA